MEIRFVISPYKKVNVASNFNVILSNYGNQFIMTCSGGGSNGNNCYGNVES